MDEEKVAEFIGLAAAAGAPLQEHALASVRRALPKFTLPDAESEVLCVRFSPDDLYLAASCADGTIVVYNALTGRRSFSLNPESGQPTMQVRWRPQQALSKTRNVLVSVAAGGRVQHWHASSGKCLHEIVEEDQLYCVDYNPDGSQFAVAGRNRQVRVFDEHTKKLLQVLRAGEGVPGHSNRVFSLKSHPTMRSCLVSGGWDNTVQFWDLRKGCAVGAICGPRVCGDSVDLSYDGTTILTGSWRADNQVQLWDFRKEQLMETLPWCSSSPSTLPCRVYAAQFSKGDNSSMIAAGGCGANEAKLFDRESGGAVFGSVGLAHAVYSLDFSSSSSMLAVAGADSSVRVLSVHSS